MAQAIACLVKEVFCPTSNGKPVETVCVDVQPQAVNSTQIVNIGAGIDELLSYRGELLLQGNEWAIIPFTSIQSEIPMEFNKVSGDVEIKTGNNEHFGGTLCVSLTRL